MAGNSFGHSFRITTFGESHGPAIGVIIDGMPPGFPIQQEDIQQQLDRRRPAQNQFTSPRKEKDQVQILSGIFKGKTTGTPIALLIHNQDQRPHDYEALKDLYRPSHADFSYEKKYGLRDWRGGGRASARETVARVAAGAIAQKYLQHHYNITILTFVEQLGPIKAQIDETSLNLKKIENSSLRCPDPDASQHMLALLKQLQKEGDSIGVITKTIVKNVPAGWGEPVFDKLHADLAKAMMSINAARGFEIGEGFQSVSLRGSQHNDPFTIDAHQHIHPQTNHAGGVLGGISTGEPIHFRIAFKPIASIKKTQKTVDRSGVPRTFQLQGRHDPSVAPRVIPIVDAMTALVLMEHALRHKTVN